MEKLNKETSGKLRKTQIITKVSDVVRELVDNSIDAQSSSIQVILDNFGIDRIEVQDTGNGIKKSEFRFSVSGGYTSKLEDMTHLSCKNAYGFRGEALNSICLISDVIISTRTKEDDTGQKYVLRSNGEIAEQKNVAIKIGTTVNAKKIFEHFPVRRQWIREKKNCRDELNAITSYLKFVGIANHEVYIKLVHNGSVIWSKPSVPSLKQAIVAAFGIEIAKNLEECESTDERILNCFLPKKAGMDSKVISFSNQEMSMVFVNRKKVQIPQFVKLIQRYFIIVASKNPINAPVKRFPFFVVNIKIDWKDVDFNLEIDKSKALITCQDELLKSLEEMLEKYYEFNITEVEDSISQLASTEETPIEGISLDPKEIELSPSTAKSFGTSRETSISNFLTDLPTISTANFSSPSKQGMADLNKIMSTPLKEKSIEAEEVIEIVTERPNEPIGFECDFNLGLDLFSSQENEEGGTKKPEDACVPNVPIQTDEWIKGRVKDDFGKIILSSVLVRNQALNLQSQKEVIVEAIQLPGTNPNVPVVPSTPQIFPHVIRPSTSDPTLQLGEQDRAFPHVSADSVLPIRSIETRIDGNSSRMETPLSFCHSYKSISGKRDYERQRTLHDLKNWNTKSGNARQESIFNVTPQPLNSSLNPPNHLTPKVDILKEKMRNHLTNTSLKECDKFDIFKKSQPRKSQVRDADQEEINISRKRLRSPSINIVGKMNSDLNLFIVNIEGNLAVFSPNNFLNENPAIVRQLPGFVTNGEEVKDPEKVLILLKEFISCNSLTNLSTIKTPYLYFLKTLCRGVKNFVL